MILKWIKRNKIISLILFLSVLIGGILIYYSFYGKRIYIYTEGIKIIDIYQESGTLKPGMTEPSVVVIRGKGTNRLSIESNSAMVHIAKNGLYEWERGGEGDIYFIGYRAGSYLGRTITFCTQSKAPAVPLAVKGQGTVNLQEWRSRDNKALTYIQYDGSLVLNKGGIKINEAAIEANSGLTTLKKGTAFITNKSISTNSRIYVSNNKPIGSPGFLVVNKVEKKGFYIKSSDDNDNSEIAWFIIEGK